MALNILAQVRLDQGRLAEARNLARESSVLIEEIDDQWDLAWTAVVWGDITLATGEIDGARTWYEKALSVCDEINARSVAAFALFGLGETLLIEGDLPGARRRFEDSLSIRSEFGEEGNVAVTELALARLALELDDPQDAESRTRKAAAEFRREMRLDHQLSASILLTRVLLADGKLPAAKALHERIRGQAGRSQNPAVRLSAALVGARVATSEGNHEAALEGLSDVVDEAAQSGLLGLELEARLAWGELELSSGRAASGGGVAGRASARRGRGRGRGPSGLRPDREKGRVRGRLEPRELSLKVPA